LNVVPGFGATAGAALAGDPRIKMLDITGGTPTGRVVGAAAGKNLCGVVSELGGKAPMVVFPDADLDAVVNGCVFGSFIATGQTCIAGTRLLVHEDVYDEVVERYVSKVQSIKIGHPQEADCQLGPVISADQLSRVEDFVALAQEEGATVLCGGRRPDLSDDKRLTGYYYEPTVIGNVTPSMRVVQEEVFGPVVVAYKFKDEAEAIQLANDSPFGLAAAIWTKDVKRSHRVAHHLDVGIIWINDHHRNDPSSPWGGTKDSGLGRENGIEALREYTQTKSVVVGFDDSPFDWFDDPNARYG
jgi:acyl-CoA reductase-like NAD-dependent aldehyde dehydrogenase